LQAVLLFTALDPDGQLMQVNIDPSL